MHKLYSVCLIFVIGIAKSVQFSDKFDEELFLKPLPSGHVNAYFQFTTNWLINKNDSRKLFKILY